MGRVFSDRIFARRLLRRGHYVICLDNLSTGRRQNFVISPHPTASPLSSTTSSIRSICEVDEIYNLACPASPPHYQADPIHTMKTSVLGSLNLLELAAAHQARIFQASTSEVYGDPHVHPQPESYWGNVNPFGPRSCYDEGKRCAETLFFDFHQRHGVDIQDRAHLQHLRPAHAARRRPRRFQFHRPGAQGRGHHHLWRWLADALVLLCRRSDRGLPAVDGRAGRPSRHRSTSAIPANSRSASWPSWSSR